MLAHGPQRGQPANFFQHRQLGREQNNAQRNMLTPCPNKSTILAKLLPLAELGTWRSKNLRSNSLCFWVLPCLALSSVSLSFSTTFTFMMPSSSSKSMPTLEAAIRAFCSMVGFMVILPSRMLSLSSWSSEMKMKLEPFGAQFYRRIWELCWETPWLKNHKLTKQKRGNSRIDTKQLCRCQTPRCRRCST